MWFAAALTFCLKAGAFFGEILPPTVGFMVQIVKATSVASPIGLTALARKATQVNTVTSHLVIVFGTVADLFRVVLAAVVYVAARNEIFGRRGT